MLAFYLVQPEIDRTRSRGSLIFRSIASNPPIFKKYRVAAHDDVPASAVNRTWSFTSDDVLGNESRSVTFSRIFDAFLTVQTPKQRSAHEGRDKRPFFTDV